MVGIPRSRNFVLVVVVLAMALALCLAPFAAAAPLAPILIDHFTTPQGPLVASLGAPASSSVSGPEIVGTERDLQVTVVTGSPGNAEVRAEADQLQHSQGSGVRAQTLAQWDGVDGSIALNPNGLGGMDFTVGNTMNAILIDVPLNDLPIDLIFTFYSGANSSRATLTLPGGQETGDPVATYIIPYVAFTTLAGSGANFSSVGAIELLIDGEDARDVTIHDIRTADLDWGDLPDNYPTRYVNNGARHVLGSLFLGPTIDPFELDGLPSAQATGDDTSGTDDENGVVRTPGVLWEQGPNRGSVDVTVTGGAACLAGWIDWNNNGSLADLGDNILPNSPLNTGTTTLTFLVPVVPDNGTFSARFRLYAPDAAGACTTARTPTGGAINGEVEDYRWAFGPNAVSVSAFSGRSTSLALPVASILLVALAAAAVVLRRRLLA